MTDLLRAVAGLPQSHGGLSVSWFGDQGRVGFCLARAMAVPRWLLILACSATKAAEEVLAALAE